MSYYRRHEGEDILTQCYQLYNAAGTLVIKGFWIVGYQWSCRSKRTLGSFDTRLVVKGGMIEPGRDSNIRGWYYSGELHQGSERV